MVLFQKQGLPTFNTLEDLIEYDKDDRKLRQLIHNYLHAQLLIRHKRKEGKYTEQEHKCNKVSIDRYELQTNKNRQIANKMTTISLSPNEL